MGLEDQHINGDAPLFVPMLSSGQSREDRDAASCIAFGANNSAGSHWDDANNPHPTLTQSARSSGGIGASNQEIFSQRGGGLAYTIHGTDKTVRVASETDLAGTIRTRAPGSIENSSTTVALEPNLTVRRLTPRECERLQGFPDDFTLIPYRHGKPAADGPRYKALGNSMAVPVIGWVLDRVQMFNKLSPQ